MSDYTPRLTLPYILPNQAQRHVTYNESLNRIDAIVHLSFIGWNSIAPPSNPEEGDTYLVGNDATGDWIDRDGAVTCYQDGAWQFLTPSTGWIGYIPDTQSVVIFRDGAWEALKQAETTNKLGISTLADETNRIAVASEASLFTHNGNGHQVKVNRASALDTAGILFQTNFEGHGEIGLLGSEHLSIKVSPNGNQWNQGISISTQTGAVEFPNGTNSLQLAPSVSTGVPPGEIYGPPNLQTIASDHLETVLSQSRIHFCPFYVDRPTTLTGGLVTVIQASTTANAILRAGVYTLGKANSDDWEIGMLVSDFGVLDATTTGHKVFDAPMPVILEPGWYAAAVGTTGEGLGVNFVQWMTPGLLQYLPYSSGDSAAIRVAGAGTLIYQNNQDNQITNGFITSYEGTPITDHQAAYSYVRQFLIPRWSRWSD